MGGVLSVGEGVIGQILFLVLTDGSQLPVTLAANGGGGGGNVPTPTVAGQALVSTGNTPTSFAWEDYIPIPSQEGDVLTATGTTRGAWDWSTLPTVSYGGDLGGINGNQTVLNAHMVAGTVPALGSGVDGESPDGTSGTFAERQGNWVALASDGFHAVSTLPAAVPVGAVATIVCEIHMTIDGAPGFASFGFFTQRIVVRNVGGTLLNTTGGQTDQPLAINNLGTSLTSAQAKIDVTTATPTIQVARPAGVACHARMAVVDFYFGTSGV